MRLSYSIQYGLKRGAKVCNNFGYTNILDKKIINIIRVLLTGLSLLLQLPHSGGKIMQFSLDTKIIWHQAPRPLIIGIGGCSRAGKTTLARLLSSELIFPTAIIGLDECVLPPEGIPFIRDHINWEIPASIDFEMFRNKLSDASARADIIIIEGLFVFNVKEIFDLLHVGIYLSIPRRRFIAEKKTDLRWGVEPLWYIHYIWRAHRNNAFALRRRWGGFPLMFRFPGSDIPLALPELVSVINVLH